MGGPEIQLPRQHALVADHDGQHEGW